MQILQLMSLFSFSDPILINIPDGTLIYYPDFFAVKDANFYFNVLLRNIAWQQDTITVFGKTYLQPRLTALYANNDKPYSYSNINMLPHMFFSELDSIKSRVEAVTKTNFTSCLLNLYRNGNDSNGWHSDNEKSLGNDPVIASVSFGAQRMFQLKHKTNKALKQNILLSHGSLLVMKGKTQEFWKHQIPKTTQKVTPRINLTFRYIN